MKISLFPFLYSRKISISSILITPFSLLQLIPYFRDRLQLFIKCLIFLVQTSKITTLISRQNYYFFNIAQNLQPSFQIQTLVFSREKSMLLHKNYKYCITNELYPVGIPPSESKATPHNISHSKFYQDIIHSISFKCKLMILFCIHCIFFHLDYNFSQQLKYQLYLNSLCICLYSPRP